MKNPAKRMMAWTYPLEIVRAARFVKDNPNVKGDQLDEKLKDQTWDDSVKSLVAFPQVLALLDQKLDCEAAAQVLVDALRSGEGKAMLAVLGQAGNRVVLSGDPVSDRRARERFVAAYDDQHRLEAGGGKVVLVVGRQDFPFPIPIVPDGPTWRFNRAAGREKIVNRRIGQNELNTIQICLAYVYWPTNPGEPPSPLGPFIVDQDGVMYLKNLGPNSAATARAMKQFNPDSTWTKV